MCILILYSISLFKNTQIDFFCVEWPPSTWKLLGKFINLRTIHSLDCNYFLEEHMRAWADGITGPCLLESIDHRYVLACVCMFKCFICQAILICLSHSAPSQDTLADLLWLHSHVLDPNALD
jgi:hypothetical protein